MTLERWDLIGRCDESGAALEALEGDPPRSLVIAGPHGVGRTRLAREALTSAERHGRRVLWARATRPAASIPLGALAHLLPPMEGAPDPLALLQRATAAMSADGSPTVLAVDDVHLLDPLSVALLEQLAESRRVTMVLTLHTGGADPDPLSDLWKDGLAVRVDLGPLQRPEAERLAAHMLGGDLDSRTAERLWLIARGNPLFLREVLEDGRRTGRLTREEGIHHWEGPMRPSDRLSEIVLGHLALADPAEVHVLQVLAAVGSVPAEAVAQVGCGGAVTRLQQRGAVADDPERPGALRCAHPVHAAVLRARTPDTVLREIRRRLVPTLGLQVLLEDGLLVPGDGVDEDPQLLVRAAEEANARLDHTVAERLGRAAVAAGGGVRARIALAEALQWLGDAAASEQLTRLPAPGVDDDRARLAAVRAVTLAAGLLGPGAAMTVLGEAACALRSGPSRCLVTATRAVLAALAWEFDTATRLAAEVLGSPDACPVSRALAAAAEGTALSVRGRPDEGREVVRTGWTSLAGTEAGAEVALATVALAHAEVLALHLGGHIHEMQSRTEELHARSLAGAEWAGDAVATMHRGWAALASGQVPMAVRWLTEALVGFARSDPVGMRGLAASLLAVARTQIGDLDGAAAALEAADSAGPAWLGLTEPVRSAAGALLAAAERRHREAGDLVLAAADHARDSGAPGVQVLLLHVAARLGRAQVAAAAAAAAATQCESALATACAAHVRASLRPAGPDLEEVSYAFEDLGALLCASRAAMEAGEAHERAGDRRAAAACSARAVALARACGLAGTKAQEGLAELRLTPREQQVARLAAGGLSNVAIAERLTLSVRTIEAHLGNVYAKLAISRRDELAVALDGLLLDREPPAGRRQDPLPSVATVATYGRSRATARAHVRPLPGLSARR